MTEREGAHMKWMNDSWIEAICGEIKFDNEKNALDSIHNEEIYSELFNDKTGNNTTVPKIQTELWMAAFLEDERFILSNRLDVSDEFDQYLTLV